MGLISKHHLETLKSTSTHLVNEGSETVVEGLDLLFLLGADNLNVRVDLKVQRSQEALVEGDGLNRCHIAHSHAHTEAVSR